MSVSTQNPWLLPPEHPDAEGKDAAPAIRLAFGEVWAAGNAAPRAHDHDDLTDQLREYAEQLRLPEWVVDPVRSAGPDLILAAVAEIERLREQVAKGHLFPRFERIEIVLDEGTTGGRSWTIPGMTWNVSGEVMTIFVDLAKESTRDRLWWAGGGTSVTLPFRDGAD